MTAFRNRALGALLGICSMVGLASVAVASDKPYSEGPVSVVTSIRTEPGMYETYMKYLSTTYKQMMEESKKAGTIVDYRVYTTSPRSTDDPNMYLVVTYKDMAALDGLSDKMDAVQQKLIGSQEVRDQQMIERGKMRTIVGSEMIREQVLK
jgi:quinol monooxygenase YgiN